MQNEDLRRVTEHARIVERKLQNISLVFMKLCETELKDLIDFYR